jgi:hypothetical protein
MTLTLVCMSKDSPSRRSVLKLGAGLVGTAALGGAGMAVSGTATETASDAPVVAWRRAYDVKVEKEYELHDAWTFTQTNDGGYTLFGEGARIEKTGTKNAEFALVKTDVDGNKQWVGFADPGDETYDLQTEAGVQTSDGGYGMVGTASVSGQAEEVAVAVAGKIGPDGEEVWAKRFDTLDQSPEGGYDNAVQFEAAVATADGGFVAFGNYTNRGWYVKFAADGTVVTDQTYDADWYVYDAYALDSSYLVFVQTADGFHAIEVSETGEQVSSMALQTKDGQYEREVIPTDDGGYAYTESNSEDVYLGKLAADGTLEWEQTYNGPYDGNDYAFSLTQTDDGGYALGSRMEEAYSGEPKQTFVKADSEGTEQWRKIIDTQDRSGPFTHIVQADDGGLVGLDWTFLVKLEAAEAEPTGTPTESPTETPDDGDASGTPEGTPDNGTETPTADGGGSGVGGDGSNGGTGGDTGEDDCEI